MPKRKPRTAKQITVELLTKELFKLHGIIKRVNRTARFCPTTYNGSHIAMRAATKRGDLKAASRHGDDIKIMDEQLRIAQEHQGNIACINDEITNILDTLAAIQTPRQYAKNVQYQQ